MYDSEIKLKISGNETLVHYHSKYTNDIAAKMIAEKFINENPHYAGYEEINILSVNKDDAEIEYIPRSIIMRIRRITGYLSVIDNFNSAKKAEEKDRTSHYIETNITN
ncbi:MAG: anaerobic ribonucleoside-triphosphate reductase [Patescibacteria group bacterium]|jgi:hypothetical protein